MPLGPMDVSHNDGVLQPPTSGIFHPVLQCGVKQQLLGEGGEPEGRVADVGVVWLSKLSSRDVRRRFCGDVCESRETEQGKRCECVLRIIMPSRDTHSGGTQVPSCARSVPCHPHWDFDPPPPLGVGATARMSQMVANWMAWC